MLFIKRRRSKTRLQSKKLSVPETSSVNNNNENTICNNISHTNNFASNITKYIGETVTIFVKGGGISGSGFSGVLISVNDEYAKLLTCAGPVPACSLKGSLCQVPPGNFFRYCPVNNIITDKYLSLCLGSTTYIPIEKMSAFVHNSI